MVTPRIVVMGEEVAYDSFPGGDAVSLEDHFKPVRISPRAIDQASKIVPSQHWINDGLHTWLKGRAEKVFDKLSSSEKEGRFGHLIYQYEYDADGPVLKNVKHKDTP